MATQNTNRVRITQRVDPCTCGCKGRDSWHAATLLRTVRYMTTGLDMRVVTHTFGEVTISAHGYFRHPCGEEKPCGMMVVQGREIGWIVLD